MKTHTICLIDLESRTVLVIGGGSVAERKARSLVYSGAVPVVISPGLSSGLEEMVAAGEVQAVRRAFQPGDILNRVVNPPGIVIAATDDDQVNKQAWHEAVQAACLVNVVDDPEHSNFIVPAVVRRGDFTLAVSTGGGSPALASKLRKKLEDEYGDEYGKLVRLLADLRPAIMDRFPDEWARRVASHHLVESDLIDILQSGGTEAARSRAFEILDETEARIDNGWYVTP